MLRGRQRKVMRLSATRHIIDPLPFSTCCFARKLGSDAVLMACGLRTSDHAGFEKVELSAPVHLALDELEFGDLTLGLLRWTKEVRSRRVMAPCPWHAVGERRRRSSSTGAFEPGVEFAGSSCVGSCPGSRDDVARLGEHCATPVSIAATVNVSAFEIDPRPVVSEPRDRARRGRVSERAASSFLALRRRPAHSLTTRRHPRKPCCLGCRQSSAPFR